jgi:hypothetical protein
MATRTPSALTPRGGGSKNSFARGRPWARCAGFGGSVGCARGSKVGCRSRQATLGPSRDPRRRASGRASGLAAPRESIGAAKGRRKPDQRRQSRDTGGGLPQKRFRENGALGATCRWKAFWAVKPQLFDERGGGSVLGASHESLGETGSECGVRQRASEVLRQRRTWSKTPR